MNEGGYEARKIVNYLIDNFDPQTHCLTNLKMQKSLFLMHAIYLCRKQRPLIRNHFETWEYGPVISSVYHDLKIYGNGTIRDRVKYYDYAKMKDEYVSYQGISEEDREYINTISLTILNYDISYLMKETHKSGGPWDKTVKIKGRDRSHRIPNEAIIEHYMNEFGGNSLN